MLTLGFVDLEDIQGSFFSSCIGFAVHRENSFQLILVEVHIFVTTLLTRVVIGLEKQISNDKINNVLVNVENKRSIACRLRYKIRRHSFAIELTVIREKGFTFFVYLKLLINPPLL